MYMCIYIYIYIRRERERDIYIYIYIYVYIMYIYIYMYVHMYICVGDHLVGRLGVRGPSANHVVPVKSSRCHSGTVYSDMCPTVGKRPSFLWIGHSIV